MLHTVFVAQEHFWCKQHRFGAVFLLISCRIRFASVSALCVFTFYVAWPIYHFPHNKIHFCWFTVRIWALCTFLRHEFVQIDDFVRSKLLYLRFEYELAILCVNGKLGLLLQKNFLKKFLYFSDENCIIAYENTFESVLQIRCFICDDFCWI